MSACYILVPELIAGAVIYVGNVLGIFLSIAECDLRILRVVDRKLRIVCLQCRIIGIFKQIS